MTKKVGPELGAWMEALPESFDNGGDVLYEGRNTIKRFTLDGRNVVAKRFKRNGLLMRIIRSLGFNHKARSSYQNAQELIRRGFLTPEPLAYVEKHGLGGITDSYYICAETLNAPIAQEFERKDWNRKLAEAYGRYVATLHMRGVLHEDLNKTNVLFEKTPTGGYQFELIDINRMRMSNYGFSEEECMENLTLFTSRMTLYATVAESYAEARQWSGWKVEKMMATKVDHDQRWRIHQKLKHPLRKGMAMLLMLALAQVGMAQCVTEVKAKDKTAYDKAVETFHQNHYADANAQLKKIAARNPKSADVQFYLGMVAAKQDINPAAIRKYFTKTIELCPDYPNALAHYYMGVVHYSDAHYEQAVEELNRYFELTNNSGNAEYESVYADASSYLQWSQFLAEAELNKAPFNPVVVRGVSSKYDEYLPYMTWDGRQCYYLRMLPEEQTQTFYTRQMVTKVPRMMLSTKKGESFSAGELLPAPFNQHDNEGGVSITADNRLLFYSVVTRNADGYNNCDIYYSEFRGGAWTDIKNAGRQVNGEKSWDSQPSISPDGQTLYFASNRSGGLGGTDIWKCHRLPNGDWSRAENLGSGINTAGNEKCPFIHADGHTLFFASDGWQGFGGYDMYFANLNDNSATIPTNMGLPINTEDDDICFGVTADGLKAYFAGKQSEVESVGGRDVYDFDLYPAARPEPMYVAQIVMTDTSGEPLTGKVIVRRYGADDAIFQTDASGKAVVMLSGKEDNVLVLESDGCRPAAQYCKASAVKAGNCKEMKYSLGRLKVGETMVLPKLSLDATKKNLDSESKKLLDVYVEFLQQHPTMHLSIVSPTSGQSQLIMDYMVSQKLRKERLSIGSSTNSSYKFVITQL